LDILSSQVETTIDGTSRGLTAQRKGDAEPTKECGDGWQFEGPHRSLEMSDPDSNRRVIERNGLVSRTRCSHRRTPHERRRTTCGEHERTISVQRRFTFHIEERLKTLERL